MIFYTTVSVITAASIGQAENLLKDESTLANAYDRLCIANFFLKKVSLQTEGTWLIFPQAMQGYYHYVLAKYMILSGLTKISDSRHILHQIADVKDAPRFLAFFKHKPSVSDEITLKDVYRNADSGFKGSIVINKFALHCGPFAMNKICRLGDSRAQYYHVLGAADRRAAIKLVEEQEDFVECTILSLKEKIFRKNEKKYALIRSMVASCHALTLNAVDVKDDASVVTRQLQLLSKALTLANSSNNPDTGANVSDASEASPAEIVKRVMNDLLASKAPQLCDPMELQVLAKFWWVCAEIVRVRCADPLLRSKLLANCVEYRRQCFNISNNYSDKIALLSAEVNHCTTLLYMFCCGQLQYGLEGLRYYDTFVDNPNVLKRGNQAHEVLVLKAYLHAGFAQYRDKLLPMFDKDGVLFPYRHLINVEMDSIEAFEKAATCYIEAADGTRKGSYSSYGGVATWYRNSADNYLDILKRFEDNLPVGKTKMHYCRLANRYIFAASLLNDTIPFNSNDKLSKYYCAVCDQGMCGSFTQN